MQGIGDWIPTAEKVNYLNQLMQVGFDVIDFGSFVSPKAIPQLRDTAEVLSDLNWPEQRPEMLAIIANVRGANDACSHEAVDTLGYPFSISETFQQRNTNAASKSNPLDGKLVGHGSLITFPSESREA